MKANPGGVLDPADVIGRDQLIRGLWRILARQSLELSAERRMGKSSVIKKMTAEPAAGFAPVYQDLEGLRSPLEFVESVYRQAAGLLSGRRRRAERLQALLRSLGGFEIKGLKIPRALAPDWKRLLQALGQDLAEQLEEHCVFFWDELPFMLQNIKADLGVAAARELLDELRSLRQTCPRLRMVFTGSIGLHHVLRELRDLAGATHAPMNDMDRVEVPPLPREAAVQLAEGIMRGESMAADDPAAAAAALAEATDGIPFYIHLVLDGLIKLAMPVSLASVRQFVWASIEDPTDPWHLGHFQERTRAYYGPRAGLSLGLLDALADPESGRSRDELERIAEASHPGVRREDLADLLAALVRDHYLEHAAGRYRFRYQVLRRWWCLQRLDGRLQEGVQEA